MSRDDVEVLLTPRDRLGEGPIWDAQAGVLWWTDIEGERIHRAQADGSAHRTFDLGLKVGAIGLCREEGLVLATARGFMRWHRGGLEPLANPLPEDAERFNDGVVDPLGRFWAGSLGGEDNALFALERSSAKRVWGGFGLPNGMGFSPDERTFYLTDSDAKTIYACAFDPATGEIGELHPFVVSQSEPGVPDGLTVDAEGFVWSARWGGAKLSRYDPDGRLEREIRLPVTQPTSCAFGGETLNTLFVTSARQGLSADALADEPLAGSVLVLWPGAKGKLEYRFAG